MADTFLEIPEELLGKVIIPNHIDGVTTDSKLSNLEWVTYSGNLVHAYKTGLRSDNTPVLIKDIRNDEVTSFYSLQECARFFGVNGVKIFNILKKPERTRIYFGNYLLAKEGEQWPKMDQVAIDKARAKSQTYRPILIFDQKTETYHIHEAANSAARLIGISSHLVRATLRKAESGGYVHEDADWWWCYLDLYEGHVPSPKFVGVPRSGRKGCENGFRKPVPVRVTELATGMVTDWNSCEAFAASQGVSKSTMQKHVWTSGGIWKKTHRVVYLK